MSTQTTGGNFKLVAKGNRATMGKKTKKITEKIAEKKKEK